MSIPSCFIFYSSGVELEVRDDDGEANFEIACQVGFCRSSSSLCTFCFSVILVDNIRLFPCHFVQNPNEWYFKRNYAFLILKLKNMKQFYFVKILLFQNICLNDNFIFTKEGNHKAEKLPYTIVLCAFLNLTESRSRINGAIREFYIWKIFESLFIVT